MAASLRLSTGSITKATLIWAIGGAALLAVLLVTLRLVTSGPVAVVDPLEAKGRRFVELALALGRIDSKEVDSYSGPEPLQPATGEPAPSLDALDRDLARLASDVAANPVPASERQARLASRISHFQALVETIRTPRKLTFDEEAKRVYGFDPVPIESLAIRQARTELDRLLPGSEPLWARVDAFRARYVIPEHLREAVFARALGECRRRTLAHWRLPATEKLDIEWTSAVDAAWHRYLGNYRSRLQINPQAVAFIGSALDVACHEGYPGHHAQFVMQELAARPRSLPTEDRIVLLRSPESMFREGAANYGVDLAFPAGERLVFERDVLFPLAGLPAAEAATFEKARRLIDVMSPATAPILRDYRDGRLTADQAATALQHDALVSSPRALLGFVDMLGPYALGYTTARDWIAERVRRQAAGGDPWTVLGTYVAAAGPPARPTSAPKENP